MKLLWVDLESTGLDLAAMTVLEAAWTITEPDGTLCLPLRSRYCALSVLPPTVPQHRNPNGAFWNRDCNGDRVALRMAEASGLFDDWLACPPALVLSDGSQLERLILDDLAAVVDPGDDDPDPQRGRAPERVHLAGAGAARFDYNALTLHCPRLVPTSGGSAAVHYRPVDVSGNQTGLLGSSMDHEMVEWAVARYGEDITKVPVGSPPQYAYPGKLDVRSREKPHRAAADVARAIIAHRGLHRFAAPLREALAEFVA